MTGAQTWQPSILAGVFLLSTALRDEHRAALRWLCLPCRLLSGLFRGGFAVNSPIPLSPIPALAPCAEPSGVSPALSETAPSHELSFCAIVWLWPFLCKDSKGKPCSKALHNHVLFTQALCAQIILLNNDSSLYLQPQANLPLFASGNFPAKGLHWRWCLFLQHINHNIFDHCATAVEPGVFLGHGPQLHD